MSAPRWPGETSVTSLTEVPRRLLVLGGGPTGVEMAQALARLGAAVALVEGAEHVLPREPNAVVRAVGKALAADGVELRLGQHTSAARSLQVLAFVARRLHAESVVMLFAEREPAELEDLARLPDLRLQGVSDTFARELLASVMKGPLDTRVRDRILAETRDNPLALLELPRDSSPAQLAGGFGVPDQQPLRGRIEASFRARVQRLPADTQQLLLTAAAEPTGEPALLWRAAAELGITSEAVAPAEADDLLRLVPQVTFRHAL